ncbi:MAG: response regulator [Anaerolinea sp.]|nr:response regulator [Anaerolinea sp.]
MTLRRILIVEDDSDLRDSLAGVLKDYGYTVSTAASRDEALKTVAAARFHLVLLDVRLDESDITNEDGLLLLRELRALDPTLEFIIITGFATVSMTLKALQPDESGRAPAFEFLEKTPDNLRALPRHVQRAFDVRLAINEALTIIHPPDFYADITKQMRFQKAEPEVKAALVEEAEEVLRKLFTAKCERIEIDLKLGFSRAAVMSIKPHYAYGEGEIRFVKLGEHSFVQDEMDRYHAYVRGIVQGHRVPQALEYNRTRTLAGLVYSFAGLGSTIDYADAYAQASAADVAALTDNLFLSTCDNLHNARPQALTNADIRALYFNLLRVREDSIRTGLESILSSKQHPLTRLDDRHIEFDQSVRLIDPVRFVLDTPFIGDVREVTVHGDLHSHNVLIDTHGETWLIDFSHTGRGPELHDYITFETFLRVNVLKNIGLTERYLWERALLDESPLPPELERLPELAKMHRIITHIRNLALRKTDIITRKLYYYGLTVTALRLLTVMFLDRLERDHALIAASLAAERFSAQ